MDTPSLTPNPTQALLDSVPTHVVGLGASAGGLEALQKFFGAMPDESGMAFVVIQHLSPHFKSMMDELLSRHTKMSIVVVKDSQPILANHVYLLPPGHDMVLNGDRLSVRAKNPEAQLQTPISDFFCELGEQLGERSVGIVLSGTGSDGSVGVRAIWEFGGLVLVQDQKSAKFDSMPNHAMAAGLSHAVLPPSELAKELLRLAHNRAEYRSAPISDSEDADGGRNGTPFQFTHQILSRLDRTFDLNFAQYKTDTVRRRIERRMVVTNISSLEAYANKIEEDDEELHALYNDLLIGVTQFMRDEEAFTLLQTQVIPKIIEQRGHREEIRLWVAGCSTGEEAYSLAILFLEAIDSADLDVKLRVFATDRHRGSLNFGGEGVYSDAQLSNIPAHLRDKYFAPEEGHRHRVVARLRKCLIFSSHNVLKDPPFTNIDLVSCRNLLIYFKPQSQRRVLGVLYFALRTNGYMFLGSSESNKDFEREFRAVSSRWKVYEKITSYRLSSHFGQASLGSLGNPTNPPRVQGREPWLTRAYSELLRRYIPTGALVSEQRKVLHLFGDVQNYLRPPEGRMTQDLVDMAGGNLKLALSSAMQRVSRNEEPVDLRSVAVQDIHGNKRIVDVRAEPLHDSVSKVNLYLVMLLNERADQGPAAEALAGQAQGAPPADQGEAFHSDAEAHEHINRLESELSHARQSLQSVVEELETSNEELQSSNEELLASNEELQSTNEELHSVNEELYSVNAEHEQKIHELHNVTGDLRNLMQATDVGLVFTDKDLKIRLFTPKASEILNILPQDVGREIHHLTSKVRADEIQSEIKRAAQENCTIDARITLDDGRVFLRRITPYVDLDHERAGLIITFIDISELHRAQASQAETETRVSLATKASGVGIWEWQSNSETIRWDARMFELYGFAPEQEHITPQQWQARVKPQDWQKIKEALAQPAIKHRSFDIGILHGEAKKERIIRVDLTSRPDADGQPPWLVGTHADVTKERRAQERLLEDEARYRSIMEHSPQGIASLNERGEITQVNGEFARIFGASQDSYPGQQITRFVNAIPECDKDENGECSAANEGATVGFRVDGSSFPLDLRRSEVRVQGQPLTLLFANDLTEQQQSARRRQLLAAIVENTDDAIMSTTLDATVLSWNQGAERIYGYSAKQMLGKNLANLVPHDRKQEHETLLAQVRQGKVVRNRELTRVRADHRLVDVAITVSPMLSEAGQVIGLTSSERDISEQKRQAAERQRIEAKMIESAKLESLGVLAGGIAHDFNNLLSGILGSTSVVEGILDSRSTKNDVLGRNIRLIKEASGRAAELCHQLLAYSGRGRFLIERINLSQLVRETAQLISSSISKQVKVLFELDENLPVVAMDATQVRQVVMNLVINAAESMGSSPGKIRVCTGVQELTGKERHQNDKVFRTEIPAGSYVTLTVQDSGCGIEPEQIERVFDPFYTTKFTGRGLGLSAVLGIARGHQGGMWVKSEQGEGTTFTLFLQAQDQDVEPEPLPQVKANFQGQGTVLIVDDEALIRESLSFLLQSMGYATREATDGIEALELLKARPHDFAMVFLDLTMPRLNGNQTLRELRRMGNEVPVLLMSGYHRNEATAAIDERQISGFIPKPFDRQGLVAALHRAFPDQAHSESRGSPPR